MKVIAFITDFPPHLVAYHKLWWLPRAAAGISDDLHFDQRRGQADFRRNWRLEHAQEDILLLSSPP
jgi:hypothetical protein